MEERLSLRSKTRSACKLGLRRSDPRCLGACRFPYQPPSHLIEDKVAWLDVAMGDIKGVYRRHALRELPNYGLCISKCDALACFSIPMLQPVLERLARHELHDDHQMRLVERAVQKFDNVIMVEPAGHMCPGKRHAAMMGGTRARENDMHALGLGRRRVSEEEAGARYYLRPPG